MRESDVEKGLLTGVAGKHGLKHGDAHIDDERRHRVCCERRRRTWRLLMVAFVASCVCFSIVHLERRSMIDIGGATQWRTASSSTDTDHTSEPSHIHTPSAPHAGPVEGSPEYTIMDTLHHMTAEAGRKPATPSGKPAPFWGSGIKKPAASHKGMKLYRPTEALRKLASKLHQALPKPTWLQHWAGVPPPTHADQVYLLLSAAQNKAFKFSSDAKARLAQIQPATQIAFAHMLRTVMPSGTEEADARLYMASHDAWLQTHRNATRLTVFSKSYCPYSKRAKALLKGMGAHFTVHEVDVREDAAGLQSALREVSGHRTFPTIFLGDELIGGSDDLQELFATNVLEAKLKAANVQFDKPAPAAGRRDDASL